MPEGMASALEGTAVMMEQANKTSFKVSVLMELFEHMFSSYLSMKGLLQEAEVSLALHL